MISQLNETRLKNVRQEAQTEPNKYSAKFLTDLEARKNSVAFKIELKAYESYNHLQTFTSLWQSFYKPCPQACSKFAKAKVGYARLAFYILLQACKIHAAGLWQAIYKLATILLQSVYYKKISVCTACCWFKSHTSTLFYFSACTK